MWLKEIFSCYVSNTYRGDQRAFQRIQQYFEDAGRYTEEKWRQKKTDDTKAVYAKGKKVALSFDYQSPALEVRSIIDYSEPDGTIMVSVGNSGFPFEARLAKPRFQALLNKIDAYIRDQGIEVKPIEQPNAT